MSNGKCNGKCSSLHPYSWPVRLDRPCNLPCPELLPCSTAELHQQSRSSVRQGVTA